MNRPTPPHRPPAREAVLSGFAAGLLGLALALGAAASTPLSPPSPISRELRELRGGESHRYPLDLEAGQSLRAVVRQDGIDVVVRLLAPDGAPGAQLDSPNGRTGEEDLAAVAATSGRHELEVASLSESAPPGRYQLRIEGPREPTPEDRLRAEAVAATWAGFHGEAGFDRARAERAIELRRRLGERIRAGELLSYLAHKLRAAGLHLDAARAWDDSAAELVGAEEPRLRTLRLGALHQAGHGYRRLALWDEARARFEAALAYARELGDLSHQASMLGSLGNLRVDMGDPEGATRHFTESLELARRAGDREGEIRTLNNLGNAWQDRAEPQRALEHYFLALERARSHAEPRLELAVLTNLGNAYSGLGDWHKALDYLDQALDLARALDSPAHEAAGLQNRAVALRRLGRYDEALAVNLECIELARSTDHPELVGFLANLAYLHFLMDQPEKAVEIGTAALPEAANRSVETWIHHTLGGAYRKLGRLDQARTSWDRMLQATRRWGDRYREAAALAGLAGVERAEGNLGRARELARSAVELVETLRSRVAARELRASFLASKQSFYEELIGIEMELHRRHPERGHAAAALRESERARARSLIELLSEAGADLRSAADPALAERERRLRAELNALELRRLERVGPGAEPEGVAGIERRIGALVGEIERLEASLRAGSSRYDAFTSPRPLDLPGIQGLLDGRAVLLEYALGVERSWLWVVGPGSLHTFELPTRRKIEQAALRYYQHLTARNRSPEGETLSARRERLEEADRQADRAGAELAAMVLGPAEPLFGEATLLIVADGALQYVPFAALPLPAGAAAVGDRHEVVALPSASTLAVLRRELGSRPPAAKALAVFADPVFEPDDPRVRRATPAAPAAPAVEGASRAESSGRRGADALPARRPGEVGDDAASFRRLRFSAREAEAIAGLLPPEQVFKRVGIEASRAAALDGDLERYRVVHFATHGVLHGRHPALSGLVLSLVDAEGRPQDGFLRLHDIYNLRLNADLVALSACRTALGREVRGEGLLGLTRGFIYAGAERVLASLWSVDDRATAELMKRFYQKMLGQGLPPARALREAQTEMRQRPEWQSPYFWAGFTLQGEWR
jgi:CHAT domain-containing protein